MMLDEIGWLKSHRKAESLARICKSKQNKNACSQRFISLFYQYSYQKEQRYCVYLIFNSIDRDSGAASALFPFNPNGALPGEQCYTVFFPFASLSFSLLFSELTFGSL